MNEDAEIRRLNTEIERLRDINAGLCHTVNAMNLHGARQDDELRRLRNAMKVGVDTPADLLRKYGTHTSDCRWRGGHDCDCGLDTLRSA
jgi:hypothetical protein